MKILMVTNTYLPHVGGVARSVATFAKQFGDLGHSVLVVAPTYTEETKAASGATDVIRVPAIEHFRDTDFSLPLPLLGEVRQAVTTFQPNIVHSHHPFLLGDTALRLGAAHGVPVVFTHHTQYDKYAHYIADTALAKRFIIDLAVGYCNLCDAVIAPSETMADLLRHRGVSARIEIVPTGVDVQWFGSGRGDRMRHELKIPKDAFVIGHVGRLAPEKNLGFLAESVAQFLAHTPQAWLAVAGVGPARSEFEDACARHDVTDRLIMQGLLMAESLRDFYDALDVFAFSSRSETQGIVLAEAMAAGTPVVALDGPGVRELVCDGVNGRLLKSKEVTVFKNALTWVHDLSAPQKAALHQAARATAEQVSLRRCAERALDLYIAVIAEKSTQDAEAYGWWASKVRQVEEEVNLWANVAHAIGDAIVQAVFDKKETP